MKRRILTIMALVLIVFLAQSVWFASSQGITLTVNSLVDDGSGTCPGAPCTLRAALLAANDDDIIDFSVTGTIFVNAGGTAGGALPTMTANNVTINGNQQITLDGSLSIPPPLSNVLPYGLRITTDGNQIFGLEITNFEIAGIFIDGGNGNQIGGSAANQGNHIHQITFDGIVLVDAGTMAEPNVIEGNLIGTDATGSSPQGNGANGIRLTTNSNFNRIGGPGTAGNVISANGRSGIAIEDNSTNITIEGNRIGIDAGLGTIDLGNGENGIYITPTSSDNLVQDNVISGNGDYGIWVQGSSDNQVIDNLIGVDASFGIVGVGNDLFGIQVSTSDNTVITGNTVADNGTGGILVNFGSTDTVISGNQIGLGSDGTTALGNSAAGIELEGADNTSITGNTIAANTGAGIGLEDLATTTMISNNVIGLDEAGGVDGNGTSGILINGTVTGSQITGNTIAQNGADGVTLIAGSGNTLTGNSIFNNGGLGIDIAPLGVTGNDAGDVDGGPNGTQNFPVIITADFDGTTTTTLAGTFNSNANSTFDLEFFSNAVCDPSNNGEGETVLTIISVMTDTGGDAAFSFDVTSLGGGEWITATATNTATGNTSEFSACIEVTVAPPIAQFSAIPTSGVAPLTVTFTDESLGLIDTYFWQFGDSQTSTAQNPSHTFSSAGSYTVRLTVTGPGGTDTFTRTIVVSNPPRPTSEPPNTTSPGDTPIPLSTPTDAVAVILTDTLIPAVTSTRTATFTVSPSATASRTSTATPTVTRTATNTAIPSRTSTPSPTVTSSPTATRTATSTLTPSPTWTATVPPTRTHTSTLPPTATPTASPTPALGVTKVTAEAGFDLIIQNAGPNAANNIQIVEALRPGVRYLSSRPGAPVCVEDEGVVFCALGTIGSGDSAVIDLSVLTDGTDPTSGRTIVTSDGVQLLVIDEPYLLKVGEPPVAAPGTIVTYTLRVINPTNETAVQVQVEDTMPDALAIVDASTTSGQVQVNGQDVRFAQAALTAGERVTITIVTRVRETGDFNEIINEACLTSQNNQTPSCAQMRFLRAGEIPATGEIPIYRRWFVPVLMGLLMLLGTGLFIRRVNQL